MTDSIAALRHQIDSATDLQSVVRTMRALAASSIHQYEQSVRALADYWATVNQALAVCLRASEAATHPPLRERAGTSAIGIIVFGSDQGLVGPYNEVIAQQATSFLRANPGPRVVWAVGERVRSCLEERNVAVAACYAEPVSIEQIAPLVDRLQIDTETHPSQRESPRIRIFHNRPQPGALYEPVEQQLLPLDDAWRAQLVREPWPTAARPEILGAGAATLRTLIREHLFIALYRACAESLASENASRLAAMERADKNIDELLARLRGLYHGERQSSIDEELFDVVAGFRLLRSGGRLA